MYSSSTSPSSQCNTTSTIAAISSSVEDAMEMAMEVAADDDQPFPAPYREKDWWGHAMDQLKKEKQPCGVAKVVS